MSPILWCCWVGVCLWPLGLREPGPFMAGGRAAVAAAAPAWPRADRAGALEQKHGYCRLLERSVALGKPGGPAAWPAAPHGKGRKPPARSPGAGRNLVVEVRRIELDDASGGPRGTYR